MNKEQRIKDIEKAFKKLGIFNGLASIMIGIGMYVKLTRNGDAFLPILNDSSVVNTMLVVGVVMSMWVIYSFLQLARERMQLIKELNR